MFRNWILLCLFVVSGALFSDPREFVVALHCTPAPEIQAMVQEKAEILNQRGYEGLATVFQNYADGWFGSGFFIKGEDGNLFLISNKHVLGDASEIKILIEGKSSDFILVDPDWPVFLDDQVDLALIDVPDELDNRVQWVRYSLMDNTVEEGDDVFAAGYPILFSEPSWQLTKGVVSNRRAEIAQIIDPEITHLLQHTAAIDPGNSGGPLLAKQGNDWVVIGINTWSVLDRNDAFFSLPVSALKDMINTYSSESSLTSRDDLDRVINSLIDELNSDTWTSREHWEISDSLVLEIGWDALLELLRQDEETLAQVGARFGNMSPMYMLRESSYWKVWKNMRLRAQNEEYRLDESYHVSEAINEANAEIRIESGRNQFPILLEVNRGQWQIHEIQGFSADPRDREEGDEPQEEEVKKSHNTNWVPYDICIGLDFFLVPSWENKEYSLESSEPFPSYGIGGFAIFPMNKNFSWNLGANYQSLKTYEDVGGRMEERDYQNIQFHGSAQVTYPLFLDNAVVVPYLELGLETTSEFFFPEIGKYGGGVRYYSAGTKIGGFLSFHRRSSFLKFSSLYEDVPFGDFTIRWGIFFRL